MPYNGQYFYPPRAEAMAQIGDEVLKTWMGYRDAVGQFKLNGNRNVVTIAPDRTIRFWTRHRDKNIEGKPPVEQKYQIPEVMKKKLWDMTPSGQWTVFDTELVHFKTKTVKNTLYFFDVLVWESQHLIGINYGDRYKKLQTLLGESYLPLGSSNTEVKLGENNFYIAQNLPASLWHNAWDKAQGYEFVEGLVLKRTDAISRLEKGHEVKNNTSWMCKLRKPTKNFKK